MNVTEASDLAARLGTVFLLLFLFVCFNDVLKTLEVLGKTGIGTGLTGVACEEGGWHRCISDEGPLSLTVHP